MRNLKKFLALVLAMMMVFSLMITVNAATVNDLNTVTDAYKEAVQVLNGMGVIAGRTDGSFDPKANIKRSEFATIVYRIYSGDAAGANVELYKDYNNNFSDVNASHWFAPYVNYASNNALLKGRTNGKYDPDAYVTGYEVLVTLLRAMGYGANDNFTSTNWQMLSTGYGRDLGITDKINTSRLGQPSTREEVAEMVWQAIRKPIVEWSLLNNFVPQYTDCDSPNEHIGAYEPDSNLLNGGKGRTYPYSLAWKWYGLDNTDDLDPWGRPSTVWYNARNAAVYVAVAETPVKTYTDAVTQCDVTDDVNNGEDFRATVYTNGILGHNNSKTGNASTRNVQYNVLVNDTDTDPKHSVGANGRLTEIYHGDWDKDGDDEWIIVRIDDLLAEVTKVTKVNRDNAGHVEKEAMMTLHVFDRTNTDHDNVPYTTVVVAKGEGNEWEYSVGDFVVVNAYASNGGDNNFVVNETATGRGQVYSTNDEWPTTAANQHVEVISWADYEDGAQSIIYKNQHKHDVGGTTIKDNYRYHLDEAGDDTGTYRWYKDQSGYLLGSVKVDTIYNYGVVTRLWWVDNANNGKGEARALITYMDGAESDSYVIVDKVNDDATLHGTATQSGQVVGSYFRVASDYRDNEGSDIVYDHLVAISEKDGSHVDLTDVWHTYTNVSKNVSKTSHVEGFEDEPIIYFNANSKYLVRTGTDSSNYKFEAKTGYPSKDYNNANVCYTTTKNGFVAYGLIIAEEEASNKSPVLAYVNSATYTKAGGVYTLKGLLVNGVQTDITTDDEQIVKDLVDKIGGLFYLTFSGDNINDYCQIGLEMDHNAIYISSVGVNIDGMALYDDDVADPDGSTNVINISAIAKARIEEEVVNLDEEALEDLDGTGVYVIVDKDNPSIATFVYQVNDGDIDSNVKGTLDDIAQYGASKGWNTYKVPSPIHTEEEAETWLEKAQALIDKEGVTKEELQAMYDELDAIETDSISEAADIADAMQALQDAIDALETAEGDLSDAVDAANIAVETIFNNVYAGATPADQQKALAIYNEYVGTEDAPGKISKATSVEDVNTLADEAIAALRALAGGTITISATDLPADAEGVFTVEGDFDATGITFADDVPVAVSGTITGGTFEGEVSADSLAGVVTINGASADVTVNSIAEGAQVCVAESEAVNGQGNLTVNGEVNGRLMVRGSGATATIDSIGPNGSVVVRSSGDLTINEDVAGELTAGTSVTIGGDVIEGAQIDAWENAVVTVAGDNGGTINSGTNTANTSRTEPGTGTVSVKIGGDNTGEITVPNNGLLEITGENSGTVSTAWAGTIKSIGKQAAPVVLTTEFKVDNELGNDGVTPGIVYILEKAVAKEANRVVIRDNDFVALPAGTLFWYEKTVATYTYSVTCDGTTVTGLSPEHYSAAQAPTDQYVVSFLKGDDITGTGGTITLAGGETLTVALSDGSGEVFNVTIEIPA